MRLSKLIEPLQTLAQVGAKGLCKQARHRQVRKASARRLKMLLADVSRDSPHFSVVSGAFAVRATCRHEACALMPLLDQADALLERGQLYKAGGTATVARIEMAGRAIMIKRYNIKGFTHWLQRFWRPSRAWHSWREGNRLAFLGIATPKPLAVLEKRFLGLRCRAYLVTEFLPGPDIIERFAPYVENGEVPESDLLALDCLFAALIRERISHGDLKGHNLFWDDGQWLMIDLDAMRQHTCASSFAPAFARDRARFMRNWPADSALHRLIDQRLPKTLPSRQVEK